MCPTCVFGPLQWLLAVLAAILAMIFGGGTPTP